MVSVGLTRSLKAAFLNQWNILLFLGGMGFALMSGQPDVAIPLVLAGEIGYLGLLGTHPKFRRYVEAQAAKAARGEERESSEVAYRRMMNSLPRPLFQRFDSLRKRCTELRQLAMDMRGPGLADEPAPLEDFHLSGLDRLLWLYLRLLFTQHSLEQFRSKTDESKIADDIRELEGRLAELQKNPRDLQNQRLIKVIEDNLETSRSRLANYQRVEQNYELVLYEIDRLENKIRSLSELAVNRHEPSYITGQIDQAAESMEQTEKTIGDLQFATGLQSVDEEVPQILRRPSMRVEGS